MHKRKAPNSAANCAIVIPCPDIDLLPSVLYIQRRIKWIIRMTLVNPACVYSDPLLF